MKRHSSNNDAWLAGYLLAQGFNKIYDDGATKKGLALHDGMMNPNPTDEDMENAFAAERNKLMQNPTKFTDFIPPEYRINPGTNASDNSTTGGLTSMIPKEYQVKPAEATPATNSGLLSSMFPKPAEKQPQGLFTEFLQNQSDRANAVRVATTPDESKVREMATQQAKLRNDENFNSEEYLARLHKALIKQGLPPESIETVMKQAAAETSVKQKGVAERKNKETVSAINKLIGEGNYEEAQLMLGQLAESNPNTAKYLGGVVGNKIAFGQEKELQNDKIKAGAYAKTPSSPYQASGGAIINKNTGEIVRTIPQNRANSANSEMRDKVSAANGMLRHYEAWRRNPDNADIPDTNYPFYSQVQHAMNVIAEASGYTPGQQPFEPQGQQEYETRVIDGNEYNQLYEQLTKKHGMNDTQARKYLSENFRSK